jgi:hypothetical protein
LEEMPLVNRKRPQTGDVVEIETPEGLAYAQYTYNYKDPPVWGALIRLLPGLFESRPADFSELVREKERFFVFFPLGAACNRGIVTIVAHEEIPEWARGVPLMRAAGWRDESGRVLDWWLWDGKEDRHIDKVPKKYRDLSLRELWNDALLIERIASGWRPADEV